MAATTYKQKDLENPAVIKAVADAANLWSLRCAEAFAKKGDWGSCVLGAGIGVWMVPAGKRTAVETILIHPPHTAGQGSCSWETSTDEVIASLKVAGIDAHYVCGHLD